jgi:hypothetical protein
MLPSRAATTEDASAEHNPSATDTLATGVSAKRSTPCVRHHPEVTFAILSEVARWSHPDRPLVRSKWSTTSPLVSMMDAVDAAIIGAHPQRAFAIRVERRHHQGAAVECRSLERLPPAVERIAGDRGRALPSRYPPTLRRPATARVPQFPSFRSLPASPGGRYTVGVPCAQRSNTVSPPIQSAPSRSARKAVPFEKWYTVARTEAPQVQHRGT